MTNVQRYKQAQSGRTVIHPNLEQPKDDNDPNGTQRVTSSHTFVVCADTQLGMTSSNKEWKTELEYSQKAIQAINELSPRPLYCCICGDLVEMTASMYAKDDGNYSVEECNNIQDQQNADFQTAWSSLHEDIALVCLCGNHDIGNRPTKASIERFKNSFGDDYLAFWANGSYNIVLNSSLFSDPTGAEDLYREQLTWLENRLIYATTTRQAEHIFVFGHHPWFLYHEDEDEKDLLGGSPAPPPEDGTNEGVVKKYMDSYFLIPKKYRLGVLELFRTYNVKACFSGHFHQNLVSKSSFGMDMIITSSLSLVFDSDGKPKDFDEPNTRGFRVVQVGAKGDPIAHQFVSLP